jgi:glycosyltransferase involved in cell wall biosynthesis
MQDSFRQMKHREKVIFAGRRQGRELNDILAASEGLWFVSNFEGFGIPIVEAFRAGVPVITSTVTSLPEVAGDAALLCNPADHYAIAEAMLRLARDSKLRNALIIKGMNRAKLFTWEDSAVRLWHSIEKTLL